METSVLNRVTSQVRTDLALDPSGTAAADRLREDAIEVGMTLGSDFVEILDRLPARAWATDIEFLVALAESHCGPGAEGTQGGSPFLEMAQSLLTSESPPRDRASVHLAAANLLRRQLKLAAASAEVRAARRALDDPGIPLDERVTLTARVLTIGGLIELALGDPDAASTSFESARSHAQRLSLPERVELLGGLAMTTYQRAERPTAAALAQQARDLCAGTELLASSFAALALAVELRTAVDQLDKGTAAAVLQEARVAANGSEWMGDVKQGEAVLCLVGGDYAHGLEVVGDAHEALRSWAGYRTSLIHDQADLIRGALLIRLGRESEGLQVLSDLPDSPEHDLCAAGVIAHVKLARGDAAGAGHALDACERLGSAHSRRTVVGVLLMRAAVEFQRGGLALSDGVMDHALAAMVRTGNLAPVILPPPDVVGALLGRAKSRDQSPAVLELIETIEARFDGNLDAARVSPLTKREWMVLSLLVRGLTLSGVAAELSVSPNTVKTQTSQIYRKLGVTNRRDAVETGIMLGLGEADDPPARSGA